jgi:hypothetical protein
MAFLESVTLEVPDPAATEAFYAAAFGLGDKVRVKKGFWGYGGVVQAPDGAISRTSRRASASTSSTA